MIISLTASHYECKPKSYILVLTIESLLRVGVDKIYVSISGAQENDKILLNNYLDNKKVHITYQEKKLFQFQYLEYLVNQLNDSSPDDQILFCDDDDLIMRLTKSKYCRGMQYVPENTCTYDNTFKMNIHEILETEKEFHTKWSIHNDFSGYLCPFNVVKEYFIEYPKRRGFMEDIRFMDYVDTYVIETPSPFIFHRLWATEDRPVSFWRMNLAI